MKKKILAIIPARCGSKALKHKNIRDLAGRPMLAWTIEHAIRSNLIDRAIVSTDSNEYVKIAQDYGAEVPFIRPSEFSKDSSTDLDVFKHALSWLRQNETYIPDICVHLRPTYPIRRIKDIDKCIDILIKNEDYDSIRSVAPVDDTPYKMWSMNSKGLLSPAIVTTIIEAYNLPRQDLPISYIQNACIDVIRTCVILKFGSMTGSNIYGYIMDHNYDIDTEADFAIADKILTNKLSRSKI
jgi:CMP-N,N'-diacetyllegionaminic acid synthase